jgi:acetylcholinesterase
MSLVESTFPPNHPPTSSNYTQEHIVVTINYRVNIFANPNARGLYNVTDLSVLNQRLDVEWVFEKVINFGGDPTRITMWDSLLAPV